MLIHVPVFDSVGWINIFLKERMRVNQIKPNDNFAVSLVHAVYQLDIEHLNEQMYVTILIEFATSSSLISISGILQ